MVKKSSPKTSRKKHSDNWFVGIILLAGYYILSYVFYGLLACGLLLTIVGIFDASHRASFLPIGIASIVVPLGINIVITRIKTGTWKINWPDVLGYGW